jgi:hypothetical protein
MRTGRTSSYVISLAALLAATALACLPLTASATTIHTPPWSDTFGSSWNDGLNTTAAAQDFLNNFDSGYNRYLDIADTARTSMGVGFAQDDAIWVAFGHGNAGFITFCYPENGSSCTSVLNASSSVPGSSCTSPNACLNAYSTTIKRLKLMAFVGCDTANSAGGVNLLTTAVTTDGVDSAIGFTDTIYFGLPSNGGETWATYFARSLTSGYTVSQAMAAGLYWVEYTNYGFPFGFNGYTTINGNVTTHPAAYGS